MLYLRCMFWGLLYLSSLIHGVTSDEGILEGEITESGKQKLAEICQLPDQCNNTTVFGFDIDCYSVIDSKRRILMEFTPKASCTSAVVGFFKAMGLEHEVDYIGWPHDFRDKYFHNSCGRATPCHYVDQQWFRWKIVRNPYDRAVSNYLYCMVAKVIRNVLPLSLVDVSFEEFIDYLLLLPENYLQLFLGRHAGPQIQAYEQYAYENHLPPVFNVVVKVEESEIGLRKIFEQVGVKYDLKHVSKHYRKRDHSIQRYVGNLTWLEVKDQVPHNYGYFYSKELIKKVGSLYKWDLQFYNYTYPFFIPNI